jgi:hypothetical protein
MKHAFLYFALACLSATAAAQAPTPKQFPTPASAPTLGVPLTVPAPVKAGGIATGVPLRIGTDAVTACTHNACKTTPLPPIAKGSRKTFMLPGMANGWLALPKTADRQARAAVCTAPAATKPRCAPVPVAVPLGLDIAYSANGRAMRFKATADPAGQIATRFTISVMSTAAKLQAHTASARPGTHSDYYDGDPDNCTCIQDDYGNWTCDDGTSGMDVGGTHVCTGSSTSGEPPDSAGLPDTSTGDDLSSNGTSCVTIGFSIVCRVVITGQPPLTETAPLPPPGIPWFPQSWCNWSQVFCSAGQEPADNNRGLDTNTHGKTLEELYGICEEINATEIATCNAIMKAGGGDYRMKQACIERANQRMAACFSTARQLTDNGAHLSP